MALTEPRLHYKPVEYQIAVDYFEKQHSAHWLASEVPLASDLADWHGKLTESEKNLLGNILKSYITHHTPHNTHHTSHITHQTSHITLHTSPITLHLTSFATASLAVGTESWFQ